MLPQAQTEPSALLARLRPEPAETDAAETRASRRVGTVRSGGAPSPSWPKPLCPQAASKALDASATLDLFGSVFQKSLLDLQPASQSPEAVPKVFQKFYVDLQRYSEKWSAPDPRETLAYIYGPNFCDASDPLIRLARALQRKQPPPNISFDQAYEAARTGSQYAQSLEAAKPSTPYGKAIAAALQSIRA